MNERPIRIKDIETKYPCVICPEAGLMEAAQKMKEFDVGMLPVCDGNQLIGVLTDRDITVRATAEGRDPWETKVREVMTPGVLWCYEDQNIEQCIELMERKQVRRLPVMNRAQNLVGIVSLCDLAIRSHDERLAGEVLNRVSVSTAKVTRLMQECDAYSFSAK